MEDKRNTPNIIESEILIYQTEDGHTKIDVKFEDETVWLTQAQLCERYQTSKSNISEHIKHIFEEKELDDERLKNLGGGNYWKELLDRIRDILILRRFKLCATILCI